MLKAKKRLYKKKCVFSFVTDLLVLIQRMSYPHKIVCDMESYFYILKSTLSSICITIVDALYEVALP